MGMKSRSLYLLPSQCVSVLKITVEVNSSDVSRDVKCRSLIHFLVEFGLIIHVCIHL